MIKLILKQNNITLSQFSNDLSISRPTLDTYISNHDNKIPLPNSTYQDIFDFLFNDSNISQTEFLRRYSYIIEHYKLTDSKVVQTKQKSIYSSSENDYDKTLSSIDEQLKKDYVNHSTPIESYRLALEIIQNGDIFSQYLIEFRDYSLGLKEISFLTDKQKFVYSNIFNTLTKLNSDELKINQKNLEKFLEHSKSKYLERQVNINTIKQKMSTKINDILDEHLQNTSELSKIELNTLINIIKQKL